jgi:hypothetical protein
MTCFCVGFWQESYRFVYFRVISDGGPKTRNSASTTLNNRVSIRALSPSCIYILIELPNRFHYDEENGGQPCEAAFLSELKDGSVGVKEVVVLVS